jgi:hypothetical protein
MCIAKNGPMLCDQQDVLNHWADHFTELSHAFMMPEMDTRSEDLVLSIEAVDMDVPAQSEINTAIAKLRNNKAPGSDSILVELLKFVYYTCTMKYMCRNQWQLSQNVT